MSKRASKDELERRVELLTAAFEQILNLGGAGFECDAKWIARKALGRDD